MNNNITVHSEEKNILVDSLVDKNQQKIELNSKNINDINLLLNDESITNEYKNKLKTQKNKLEIHNLNIKNSLTNNNIDEIKNDLNLLSNKEKILNIKNSDLNNTLTLLDQKMDSLKNNFEIKRNSDNDIIGTKLSNLSNEIKSIKTDFNGNISELSNINTQQIESAKVLMNNNIRTQMTTFQNNMDSHIGKYIDEKIKMQLSNITNIGGNLADGVEDIIDDISSNFQQNVKIVNRNGIGERLSKFINIKFGLKIDPFVLLLIVLALFILITILIIFLFFNDSPKKVDKIKTTNDVDFEKELKELEIFDNINVDDYNFDEIEIDDIPSPPGDSFEF